MATEVKLPPMVDHKADAGPDWFFCEGCLAYHAPEYQSRNKRFCKFAFLVVQDKEVPGDDEPGWLEKPITDLLPASILQAWKIEDVALKRLYSRKSTTGKKSNKKPRTSKALNRKSGDVTLSKKKKRPNVTEVNVTTGRKLKVNLPENEIINSNISGAVLAKKYGVSKMTISRIRRGQRILV